MNPTFLLLTAAFQLAILYVATANASLLLPGIVMVAIFGMVAFTRDHWPPHVDMILLMAGPGGAAMLLSGLTSGDCHAQRTWSHYWIMSAGMLWSVPLCWRYARCVQDARRSGTGLRWLFVESLGMQAGMTLAHVSLVLLPATPSGQWVRHVTMLAGMLVGMMAAHSYLRSLVKVDPPERLNSPLSL